MPRFTNMLLAGVVALAGIAAQAAPSRAERGAAELARALEGRTAGEPVRCLNMSDIRSSRIITGTAVLYETTNGTLYLNRPRGGARSLDRDDILVSRVFGSRICAPETIHLLSPPSHIPSGFISLGDFVPYRKPRS